MSNRLVDIGKGFCAFRVRPPLPALCKVAARNGVRGMPIILLIVSTLVFWSIYWFIQMGGIQHFQHKKAERKEKANREAAREASRTVALRAIDDPRDAAAVLMLLIARANGDPTREQIAVIENKLRTVFGFERELTERMTQARFVAREAIDFEQAAGVFAKLFKQKLTRDECNQLIDILEDIAHAESPSDTQIEWITAFKPMIGLVPAR
jgi:uncharacterized tellurite resistance protein B-like protein